MELMQPWLQNNKMAIFNITIQVLKMAVLKEVHHRVHKPLNIIIKTHQVPVVIHQSRVLQVR